LCIIFYIWLGSGGIRVVKALKAIKAVKAIKALKAVEVERSEPMTRGTQNRTTRLELTRWINLGENKPEQRNKLETLFTPPCPPQGGI